MPRRINNRGSSARTVSIDRAPFPSISDFAFLQSPPAGAIDVGVGARSLLARFDSLRRPSGKICFSFRLSIRGKMSSNNKVLKLKKKINKCQGEVQELLQERDKQGRSGNFKVMKRTKKKRIEADLETQKFVNSMDTSIYDNEIEVLEMDLKSVEVWESRLKDSLNKRQICYAEYKKGKEWNLKNMERHLKELEKIVSDELGVNELEKRCIEMEKRLKNLDNFCAAIYSTLGSKESKKCI